MRDLRPILLIEDNPDDAELIAYAFGKAGIENPVVTLSDGEQAVAFFEGLNGRPEREMPGLVLLDLKLPLRSGFEVLEAIRAGGVGRFVPVIVLTSSNQQLDVKRAYELGANSYLVKPIARDDLVKLVQALDAFWIEFNQTA